MAKRRAKAIGEVTITRGETDDAVRNVATWRLSAGPLQACIMRMLGTDARDGHQYTVTTWRRGLDGDDKLYVGPSAAVPQLDFSVAVTKAKQLMARLAR